MKKNKIGQIVITKEMFVKIIDILEKQYRHDIKCLEAFKVILPMDSISGYDNHWLENQLVDILKTAMNDNHKNSWIEYFIWELDFGQKWKKESVKINGKDFRLQNAFNLWELLNLEC